MIHTRRNVVVLFIKHGNVFRDTQSEIRTCVLKVRVDASLCQKFSHLLEQVGFRALNEATFEGIKPCADVKHLLASRGSYDGMKSFIYVSLCHGS